MRCLPTSLLFIWAGLLGGGGGGGKLCIFGVSVLFCMYFLNHRSEDIKTLYMGADKPTLRSYINICILTLSGSLPTSFKTDFEQLA